MILILCEFIVHTYIHTYVDPTIFIEITTANSPIIGRPLILQCSATTVRGITSRVDIIWINGSNTQVRRVNNIAASNINTSEIYNDIFVIPSLDISDIGSVYQCEVIINSSPPIMAKDNFTIPFPSTGMYVM